jgi:ribosome modulation factor
MRKATKKSLDELARIMPVVNEFEARSYVGGNNSGIYYDSEHACPYNTYQIMASSGSWTGGYVEGIGYVGSSSEGNACDDVEIVADKRIVETFQYCEGSYAMIEGVGITGAYFVKGGVSIENGIVSVSAAGLCRFPDAEFKGEIELLVSGVVVERMSLMSSPTGAILESGYKEIGSVSFDKKKYGEGGIEIRLKGSYKSSDCWSFTELNRTVYSSDNN